MKLISIQPIGNLANRMIQYLAAQKLTTFIPGSDIEYHQCPEWEIALGARKEGAEDVSSLKTFVIEPDKAISFDHVRQLFEDGDYQRVLVRDHMQRMSCLPTSEVAEGVFPLHDSSKLFESDELVINIRAAEIVLGVSHYPLVPVEFFHRIVEQTGLKPVFLGQLGENAYCRRLKTEFPEAKFVPSAGAIEDFNKLRLAKHLVIAVSTFSWLAAWLSKAETIHVPMLGFLHPLHFGSPKIIDLLPSDDPRYVFHLFPLTYGVPEAQALGAHRALADAARLISPSYVNFLRFDAPAIKPFFPVKKKRPNFDAVWYSSNYFDVACDVGNGIYGTPEEHFIDVGLRRGYTGMPRGFSTELPGRRLDDLAAGKAATQSSISEWSAGSSIEEDATRAVEGIVHEPFAFHTRFEVGPWWSVDLGEVCQVEAVAIWNRIDGETIAGRATPLEASISLDGRTWTEIFRTPDGFIIGKNSPITVWKSDTPMEARFVKLSVKRETFLHLRHVKVLGHKQG